jgi:hypothetical protein
LTSQSTAYCRIPPTIRLQVGSSIALHPRIDDLDRSLIAKGGIPTRQGDTVRFRISDIFLPSPEEMQTQSSEALEMEGQIVDFSDSGYEPRVFAVVQLAGPRTVVVLVSRLEVVKFAQNS